MKDVRNFCILAHIDHGKSTLADRLLEVTATVEKRKMREQFLDMHPLEREKGITIKMQPVRMRWSYQGSPYVLNLIDTPGHVDFSYEVSRALAAVEGALLLVDATQGVQAQTLANLAFAQQEKLIIIPVINKIDLPSAEIEKTENELVELLGVEQQEIIRVSAKTGEGVQELLRAIIERVPSPETKLKDMHSKTLESAGSPLRALVFDSFYDPYQGVIAEVRVFEGVLKKNESLTFLATHAKCEALEVGVFAPERSQKSELVAGDIGYVATGIKEPERVRVGDTVTELRGGTSFVNVESLGGYREPIPMVYSSIFPENQDEYELVRESLKKLKLNDAALTFEPEEGGPLGRGFRAGFLGMLHMEIIAERLRREYNLSLVFTNPSVAFHVHMHNGGVQTVYAAAKMPPAHERSSIEEPWIRGEIITPARFLGAMHTLLSEHEGRLTHTVALGGDRLLLTFEAPLRETIIDFYDQLKSISQGFASMSYALIDYRPADVVRLDVVVADEKIPSLAEIVPSGKVQFIARERVQKLKTILPQENFSVALQAAVEGRILARETIPALKKDVTGYMYGGDRTRKMKLWKKQQRGKKRLKEMGRVDIDPSVFLQMLKKQ